MKCPNCQFERDKPFKHCPDCDAEVKPEKSDRERLFDDISELKKELSELRKELKDDRKKESDDARSGRKRGFLNNL